MKREDIKEILGHFLDWHYEDDIADNKTKSIIIDTYLDNHCNESLNVEKEQPNHKTQAFEVDKVEAKEVLPMPKESLEVEGLLKMILNSYKAIMTLEDYRMVYNSIVQQAEILNNKLIDKTQHKAKEHTKPNSNHTGKINN